MTIEAVEQVGAAPEGGESGRDGLPGRPLPSEAAFRIMRITTSGGAFETPARMVSYDEQAARSAVPLSRALPTELAVDLRVVRGAGAASILAAARGAGGSPGPDRRARLHCDITERALLRVTVHQPSPAALAGMSPAARVRFADAQAELQPRDESRGVVTYPYLGLRAGDYLWFVRSRRRAGDGTALFVLDAGIDDRPEAAVHLARRDVVAGMPRQPGIEDGRHRRMAVDRLGDALRAARTRRPAGSGTVVVALVGLGAPPVPVFQTDAARSASSPGAGLPRARTNFSRRRPVSAADRAQD